MTSFLLAFQFLTTIPLKIKEISEQRIAASVIYFPLVGLFLGLFLLGISNLLSYLGFSYLASNVILVVILIIITGGMHLDGLADTTDAFLSGKSKEEMLNIMRDPCAGTMGVLSLICIILLKISLLTSINILFRPHALVLMCVLSRWSVVPVMFVFPYARREGKAGVFIKGMNLKILVLSTSAVIICAILTWQINGLIALLIILGFACVIGKFVSRKIGGITGDTLGATIEMTEIITLLTVCIMRGAFYG